MKQSFDDNSLNSDKKKRWEQSWMRLFLCSDFMFLSERAALLSSNSLDIAKKY